MNAQIYSRKTAEHNGTGTGTGTRWKYIPRGNHIYAASTVDVAISQYMQGKHPRCEQMTNEGSQRAGDWLDS
jgi:hypothetical protein